MSAADPAYLASVLDRLEEHVPVQTRPFFGGTGLVCDGVQFAMVMGTTLYFVVEETTRPRYRAAGTEPFTYRTGRGPVIVGRYHALPADVLDNPDTLRAWTIDALQAAKVPAPVGRRRRTAHPRPRTSPR